MGEEIVAAPRAVEGVLLRFLPLDAAAALSAWRVPERRWSYPLGFLRDLLNLSVSDGIVDPTDLEASLLYLANHLP